MTVSTFTLANLTDIEAAGVNFTTGPGTMQAPGVAFIANGAGAFTLTLPIPAQLKIGQRVWVKKTDTGAGAITVTPPSGQIEAGSTFTIAGGARNHNVFGWDGTNWWQL